MSHVGVPLPCLPFEPLHAFVRRRLSADAGLESLGWRHDSWQHRAWQRARTVGTVTLDAADRLACDLGRHPAEIWGREWWDTIRRVDEERTERLRVAHADFERRRKAGKPIPKWLRELDDAYHRARRDARATA